MGEKMVAVMGDNPVVMLKAHGVVAAGETVLECFAYAAYVEENARRHTGDADRRPVCVQRRGTGGVPPEAALAEPVQEDLGPLSVQDFLIDWVPAHRNRTIK